MVLFYNGRGSQEAIFGDGKTDAALDVIPTAGTFTPRNGLGVTSQNCGIAT